MKENCLRDISDRQKIQHKVLPEGIHRVRLIRCCSYRVLEESHEVGDRAPPHLGAVRNQFGFVRTLFTIENAQ